MPFFSPGTDTSASARSFQKAIIRDHVYTQSLEKVRLGTLAANEIDELMCRQIKPTFVTLPINRHPDQHEHVEEPSWSAEDNLSVSEDELMRDEHLEGEQPQLQAEKGKKGE